MMAGGRGSAHPIYVDDVVDMLVTVAIHPKAPGHAFHATPDPAVKWRDYLGYYARMAGRTRERSIPLPPAFVLKPIANIMTLLAQRRGSYHDVYGAIRSVMRDVTFSMDKARLVLGWQPKTSLDDGMVPTERWLRQTS